MLPIARSISKVIALALVIFLAAFTVVNSLPFLLRTQHPLEMIQGTSMENTYFHGDLIVLGGFPQESIQVGDVVGYERGGSIIIHRVIGIITENDQSVLCFILQGDNPVSNPFPDIPVPPDTIVGKALFHIPAWLGMPVYPIFSTLQNPLIPMVSVGPVVIPFGITVPVALMVVILLLAHIRVGQVQRCR